MMMTRCLLHQISKRYCQIFKKYSKAVFCKIGCFSTQCEKQKRCRNKVNELGTDYFPRFDIRRSCENVIFALFTLLLKRQVLGFVSLSKNNISNMNLNFVTTIKHSATKLTNLIVLTSLSLTTLKIVKQTNLKRGWVNKLISLARITFRP